MYIYQPTNLQYAVTSALFHGLNKVASCGAADGYVLGTTKRGLHKLACDIYYDHKHRCTGTSGVHMCNFMRMDGICICTDLLKSIAHACASKDLRHCTFLSCHT